MKITLYTASIKYLSNYFETLNSRGQFEDLSSCEEKTYFTTAKGARKFLNKYKKLLSEEKKADIVTMYTSPFTFSSDYIGDNLKDFFMQLATLNLRE